MYRCLIVTKGYNCKKDEPNMIPAMLFQGNINTHVYKPTRKDNEKRNINPEESHVQKSRKLKSLFPYTKVSANDEIK